MVAVVVGLLVLFASLAMRQIGLGESGSSTVESTGVHAPTTLVADPASLVGRGLPPHALYVVRSGDTLWSIARQLSPGDDPRQVVDRLVQLNGGVGLRVGQRLRLS
jgi:Tfp pilus assembly protein FimV